MPGFFAFAARKTTQKPSAPKNRVLTCDLKSDALSSPASPMKGHNMATTKPRITITLEPEQHEVLNRMAKLQGGSMSRIVSELLQEVTPILSKLCDTLQIATTANAELRARMIRSCEEAEQDLRPIADAVASQFDMFAANIAAGGDGGQAKPTPIDESGDVDPRPVTRGSRNPKRAQSSPEVMQKGESDAI